MGEEEGGGKGEGTSFDTFKTSQVIPVGSQRPIGWCQFPWTLTPTPPRLNCKQEIPACLCLSTGAVGLNKIPPARRLLYLIDTAGCHVLIVKQP